MQAIDWQSIILFIIAVFGCIFGVYQYLRKNTQSSTENDTLVMSELRHIGADVAEMKSDIKTMRTDNQLDKTNIVKLDARVTSLESDLNTAFNRIDELREKTDRVDSIDTRVSYLENIRKT